MFFATGFETTAVATAAAVLDDPPPNFFVLSAHKYIPPVMEIVAEMPDTRVEGFSPPAMRPRSPGGACSKHSSTAISFRSSWRASSRSTSSLASSSWSSSCAMARRAVENMFPRCVTRAGNLRAQEHLWRVFRPIGGNWRGIAHVPNGNLRLRDEFAHLDARRRFDIDLESLWEFAPPTLVRDCICGDIMAGIKSPTDCPLYGTACVPDSPVGACMVSSEGTCRIWHQYGGHPDLGGRRGAVCAR